MKINKTNNVFKLVIAIILLILLGIITEMMTGKNGILKSTKIARAKQINQEMQETLVLAINDMNNNMPGGLKLINITEESLKKYLEEYQYYVENNTEANSKIIKIKKDNTIGVYKIDEKLDITEITKKDINILTYKINSYENGKVKITIKIVNDIGIKSITYPESNNVIYCNGKKQVAIDYEIDLNKEYEFIITSENESIESKKINITIAELVQYQGEIIVNPSGWTTQAQVEIKYKELISNASDLGIKIQYKEGSYEENGWNDYNGKFETLENKHIIARFIDSSNTELFVFYKEINNIDRIAPTGSINLSRTWVGKRKKCTATVNIEELESGIDIDNCKYIFTHISAELGKDITKYTGSNRYFENNTMKIEDSSSVAGIYYFHVLLTDKAGNMTEVISEAIEVKNIYEITNADELQNITDLSGKYYVMNDIDMTGFDFKTIEGIFSGTLDGQGHTISNLNISNSSIRTGIFQYIKNSTIKNIIFKDVNIYSSDFYVGVIAGESANNNNFIKVGITGMIMGASHVGSFCGEWDLSGTDVKILNFQDCYARTQILGNRTNYDQGGFVGHESGHVNVGSYISVKKCYWFGTMNGLRRVGTFRGGGPIDNNDNQYTVGINVINSYYNKSTFTLSVPTASSGIGLTNEQIKDSSNYVGWDFKTDESDTEYTWYIDPKTGFPELHF